MNRPSEGFDQIGFGYRPRARHACDPLKSRGREYAEPESPTRTAFQRDRDRIIHSTAFRRLKHKTQVFVAHESDHYRTRLTHTIEVAQIARAITRALCGDEDLAEAIALAHDFGHTPFGHAGERALDRKLQPWGGFDHNLQTLRVVTCLEHRYAEFDGLNLSWETLEGLVKHNGPVVPGDTGMDAKEVGQPGTFDSRFSLGPSTYGSLEAQAAAIADDIAYDSHDIDDGLRAGLLTLEMLETVPFPATVLAEVRRLYPSLDAGRVAHEYMRRQITAMVEDVIRQSTGRLARLSPGCADDVRRAGHPIVVFSDEMKRSEGQIKTFLWSNLYRHPEVTAVMDQAETVVEQLFDAYAANPALMPGDWATENADNGAWKTVRTIADFLAGMTDTFALCEHRRLFDRTPELR